MMNNAAIKKPNLYHCKKHNAFRVNKKDSWLFDRSTIKSFLDNYDIVYSKCTKCEDID